MELRKILSIEHRPLDYLKERNWRSSVQSRKDYGTKLIGWEASRLKDNMPIKGNYEKTIKFIDNMSKNHFPQHHGKFARLIDKDLLMKRGFPYNKLDMRRQRKLVKESDNITHQLHTTTASKVSLQTPSSISRTQKHSKSKSQIRKFMSLQPNSKRRTHLSKDIKASTKKLYDKIYEDKLRAHFWVPYPKFPYNLDKDTIQLSAAHSGNICAFF